MRNSKALIGTGIALILIGILLLAVQFRPGDWSGILLLPTLALIFLVWGLCVRSVGLLIPGGVLFGVGLGAFLIERVFINVSDEMSGGIFMLAFALGWGLITLLSALIGRLHWWPLIPGGIMAFIGVALLVGEAGQRLLTILGQWWPILLILLGLYLILRQLRK